ncbi:hypothetical protein BCAR13_1240001 [Paraburkholderia caribensis]|nr:hypothetical protein BCAR13_1240001 [Paraburkholderia caribensis]
MNREGITRLPEEAKAKPKKPKKTQT